MEVQVPAVVVATFADGRDVVMRFKVPAESPAPLDQLTVEQRRAVYSDVLSGAEQTGSLELQMKGISEQPSRIHITIGPDSLGTIHATRQLSDPAEPPS